VRYLRVIKLFGVKLNVFDTAGRLVTTMVDGSRLADTYKATFVGSGLASGVNLFTLMAG
jgi:hypothetical protein